MTRKTILAATVLALAVAGCAPRTPQTQLGADGQPIPVAYTITQSDAAEIPVRVLGEVNRLRANSGLSALAQNPALQNAAAAHSRDMARQNRAWHFGSDGSSPIDRARRAGFSGPLIGEDISESYENDIATLNAWMRNRDTRDIIMDPNARSLGVAWFQESTKKIWWTIMIGG